MNKYDPIGFSRNLAKGRIAETIFEQMLRDTKAFTILAFGYEKVLPELAHLQHDVHKEETMEIIRRAPDFAIIDNEKHDVYLIEVKYMMHPTETLIRTAAEKMFKSWKPSYLFIATPNEFLFGKASEIVNSDAGIKKLSHPQIPEELQAKYIKLLNELIPPTDQPEQEEV